MLGISMDQGSAIQMQELRSGLPIVFKTQNTYPYGIPLIEILIVILLTCLKKVVQPTTRFNAKFLDLLQRIFVFNPTQRITAKEALKHPWFAETSIDEGIEAFQIYQRQHGK